MRIDVNGSRLYFDIEGVGYAIDGASAEARPTLVLLHGSPGTSDHTVFKPVFRQLADVAQIVYLDLRGSGRSDDSPDGIYSLERWADDLAAFCRQLGIDKPIVLGNSAGGMVAAMYGIRHPDDPGKLVLSSTQARLTPERCLDVFHRLGGDRARDAARDALVDVGDMASFSTYARVCMPLYNPTPRQAPRHTIFREPCARAFHELGGIWHTMDFLADLAAVRCPTLVLAGADDPVTPIEDSEDIVAHLDPALVRFERFEQAGHGVWIDHPVRAFDVLNDFIVSS
ncbi:MAG: alpha/beta fold hydrolase [Acidobacteriota bacterium]